MPETLCLCGVEASDRSRAESPQLALVDGVDLKVLEGCEGFAMELRKYLCRDRYFGTRL